MDISVLDFGGNFAGPALGLLAQGHRVAYFRRGPRQPQASLLARFGWEVDEPQWDADLVIYAASFSDEAWAYEVGIQREAPLAPDDPFFYSINPLQRRVRDRYLEPKLDQTRNLVLVDMSDAGEIVDPFYANVGKWHFKRELPFYGYDVDAEIHPFPFLYHPGLLSMEWGVGLKNFELPLEARRRRKEILFAGTVDHWRYFGRRRLILAKFKQKYPRVPLRVVESSLNVLDVWKSLQLATAALYMPGRGDLCFRLHEYSALGVPVVAPGEFTIELPDEWLHVLPNDPANVVSPVEMLDFYHKHYHPIRAAQWILDRIGAPTDRVDIGDSAHAFLAFDSMDH